MLIKAGKLVTIFIFLAGTAFSQSRYFENDPVWRIQSQCAMGGPGCISSGDYNYFIKGDTVVHNHLYKKLYKFGSGYFTWFSPPPSDPACIGSFVIGDTLTPYAFIRDSLSKIFLYGSSEQCIYDFNLNVGDTLPMDCYGYNQHVVSFIDTVIIANSTRRRFHLTGGPATILIEGMGHDYGFLELMPPILECSNNLVCYSVSDTSYFPNFNSVCQRPNSINRIDNYFEIYPQPASDYLIISSTQFKINSIKVFDLRGTLIRDLNVSSVNYLKVNFSDLANGYYFLELQSAESRLMRKIVICH